MTLKFNLGGLQAEILPIIAQCLNWLWKTKIYSQTNASAEFPNMKKTTKQFIWIALLGKLNN